MSDTENVIPPVEPTASTEPPVTPPATSNPYNAPAEPRTNVLSIISLVGGILGFLCVLPVVGALVGIITGHIALGQIRKTGEQGHGFALWGLILGYAHIALAAVGVVVFILVTVLFGVSLNNSINHSGNSAQQCIDKHPNNNKWVLQCDQKFNNDFDKATR